ncbi:DNA alkylation repair protein [Bacillus sp. MRMR6]|uniref:DNA alkylation repair protein n=1 Tax=Bacillus sp. MRMR6 TaxID=1928617 RepID=UPI0009515829|nr:DNA alkylation repair protein [Bacillus sp. MRMR6]OLS41277.1 DNA alkylation repair protein [Bacillus sp. MRMR6]
MEKIKPLITLFEAYRNAENAEPMERYMRNLFPFLGIKTPERRALVRKFFNETGMLKEPFNKELVLELWEKNEREYQYTALDYIEKSLKKLTKDDLPFFEKLITTKSWWDTVDMIAPKAVGEIASRSPEVIEETIDGWAVDEDFWLRRASILFQLKYKQRTNEKLLYTYILQNAASKEFFIQKAIGWALREYSKTNPQSVKQFISGNQLAPLSVREGSKYIS